MSKGRPLTLYEREQIETWLRMKKKKTWIARRLGRDYSIIKREVKRNSSPILPYNAEAAHGYAKRRRQKTNTRKLEKYGNEKLADYVTARLHEGWSPEEIAGRLKEYSPQEVAHCKNTTVSHESIYQWIYSGEGRFGGVYKNLRRKQRTRKPKFSRKQRVTPSIQSRVSIRQRGAAINGRMRIGDWETDSVVFRGRSILSVQQERKSRVCRLHKCEDKSARASEEALRDSIESLPRNVWLTITRDNGGENALHHETDVPSFFCDPYASWQKGGVENLNGLIREYFPKKSNLDTVTEGQVYAVQEKLNDRPRKILNYLTPNEVLALELKKGL